MVDGVYVSYFMFYKILPSGGYSKNWRLPRVLFCTRYLTVYTYTIHKVKSSITRYEITESMCDCYEPVQKNVVVSRGSGVAYCKNVAY